MLERVEVADESRERVGQAPLHSTHDEAMHVRQTRLSRVYGCIERAHDCPD